MIRQGKYTKPLPKRARAKGLVRRRWHWFKRLDKKRKVLVIGGPIMAFLILTPLLTYLYFASDIANPERLMNRNNTGVVLLDKKGEAFYSFGTAERSERLPLSKISDHAEKALISAEDKNFYQHGGFSFTSMLAALYANFVNGDPTAYGGSTITQQLAKNTLLTNDRNYLRKYQELSIAIAIERQYTKDEILDMYLNSVYYGEGAFGIQAAAEKYFNKSAADLTLAESSLLIGLLPAPSAYSPISGDKAAAKREQKAVLSRMVENKVISQGERSAALAANLQYSSEAARLGGKAPHFALMVINELNKRYGEEKVTRSGYQVKTSLDLGAQQAANQAVSQQIGYIKNNGGSNTSLVAIDPRNGEILALIGSADWNNKKFGKVNMATTNRQPGSSFKPIYYTEAMQEGVITPATILEDKPTTFGGSYRPENFDFAYRGKITIRSALAQSLNIPSVEVMQKLGVEKAIETTRRLGITTVDKSPGQYGLALALGAAEVKLLEMTNAYAAFANQGYQFGPTTILSIDDKFDDTIFTHKLNKQRVMSEDASFLISDILSDNVARAPTFGGALDIPGHDVAVKTGTTDDSRDAWTIGYTPSVAVGVWVGNNDNTIMSLGGSSMSGPVWSNTLQAILAGTESQPFMQPSGVTQLLICRANGQKATLEGPGVYREFFIRGIEPSGTCNVPRPEEKKEKPKENKPPKEENNEEPEEQEEPIDPTDPIDPPPEEEEPPEPPEDPLPEEP